MIEIEHRVKINIRGVKYNVGISVEITDEVDNYPIILDEALDRQANAVKKAVKEVIFKNVS